MTEGFPFRFAVLHILRFNTSRRVWSHGLLDIKRYTETEKGISESWGRLTENDHSTTDFRSKQVLNTRPTCFVSGKVSVSGNDDPEDIMLLNAQVGDGLPAVTFVFHLSERNMYTRLALFSIEASLVRMRTHEASPLSCPFAAWLVDDDG